MKFLIKNDLFDISKRIKNNYDDNYFIVFDTNLLAYQVYTSKVQLDRIPEYIGGEKMYYVLTFPYQQLDIRCIKYLYQTEIDDIDLLIKNLNSENEKLEKTNSNNLLAQSMTKLEDCLRKQSKGG